MKKRFKESIVLFIVCGILFVAALSFAPRDEKEEQIAPAEINRDILVVYPETN